MTTFTVILTKHGFKLNQAADKVVKVDQLILCITGHQDLVQSVIQLETYTGNNKKNEGSHFFPVSVCMAIIVGNDTQEHHTCCLHSETHLIRAHGP